MRSDLPLTGLDVDGVLYRYGRGVRKAMRERYGVHVNSDVWFTEDMVEPHQWDWLWSNEGVELTFGSGPSFPGAVRFARRLYQLTRVRILTAIPPNAQHVRRRWLRSVGIPYDELVFVGAPSANPDRPGTDGHLPAAKHEVLPHCDAYIDDSVANCAQLAEHTSATILLVDHAWNRGFEFERQLVPYPQVKRLRHWREILREIERLPRGQKGVEL